MKFVWGLLLLTTILTAISPADAPKTLVIGVHENLVPKEQLSRASITLEQLVKLIGQQVRIPATVKIIPGGTEQALRRTADALRTGQIQLAAVTGLEYGWLREFAGRDIEVLVIGNSDKNIRQGERLFVRADSGKRLEGLRGATLATIETPQPSMRVYLNQLRRQWGADFLSKQTGPFSTAAKALNEVLAGNADAAIVDIYTVQGYERVFPGRMRKLKPIAWSQPYPLVPVVGFPRVVNAMRSELWRDVRAELSQIHGQPRAAAFMEIWRVSRFNPPTDKFDEEAIQAARDFPIQDLEL